MSGNDCKLRCGNTYLIVTLASIFLSASAHSMTANGMQNIGKLTMSDSTNGGLYCAAIDTANGYAYFGGKHFITKVDIKGVLPVEVGSIAKNAQIGAVIDPAAGYGFFCSGVNLLRITLGAGNTPPAYVDQITFSASTWAAVIDTSDPNPANHYIYCLTSPTGAASVISKISVSTFTVVNTLTLNATETSFRRGVIDTQNGYAYFVGPVASGGSELPVVVKIALGAGATAPTRIGAVQLTTDSQGMGAASIDVANGYAYFGVYTGTNALPTKVYKVALGTSSAVPTLVGSVTLNPGTGALNGLNAAERELCTGIIDPASGFAYFGTDHTYPAKIFQIALGSGNALPIETGVLQLTGGTHALGEPNGPNDGEQFLPRTNTEDIDYGEVFTQSSVIDTTRGDPSQPGSHYAYFGCDSYSGQVVKVLLPPPPSAPLITNGPPPNGNVGSPYNFSFVATGSPTPTFSVSAGNLPSGLSISSTGVISGIPNAAGPFSGTVTATNGNAPDAAQNFTITISSLPVAPAFTNGPPPDGNQGAAYNFSYTATGNPAPTFSVTAGSLPTGLSLSSAGTISGTPSTAGNFSGSVTATNGVIPDATQNFSITVAALSVAPGFSNGPPPGGILNTAYNYAYSATGNPAPTFSVTSGSIPNGLLISSDGVISGTPNAVGTFNGTVTATNGINPDATQNFSITISSNNPVPTLSSIAPISTNAGGAAFVMTLTGTNFVAGTVVQWSGQSNLIPASLSRTQITLNVPAVYIAGSGTATITVFNPTPGGGTSNSIQFTVNSAPANSAPQFTSPATASPSIGPINQAMTFSAAANAPGGGATSIVWDFGDGASATGSSVSHMYSAAGNYTVTATATDANGNMSSSSVAVEILGASGTQPPAVTSPASSVSDVGTIGQPVNFSVAATDPAGNPVTFTWNFGDGSSSSGMNVTHIFTTPGIYTVVVTASDGTSSSTSSMDFAVSALDNTNSNVPDVGWAVGPINTFKITAGRVKLMFTDASKDGVLCSGTLPVTKFFQPQGKIVTVSVGGVQSTFTLSSKGMGSSGTSKFKLSGRIKKGILIATPAKFSLTLQNMPLSGAFQQFGFTNSDTPKTGSKLNLPVVILIDQIGYEDKPGILYKAKGGKSGMGTVSK